MTCLEPSERPFEEVDYVGVAIQRLSHGLHSGLLYRTHGGEPRILHLAFHHDLRDEVAAAPYRWAQIDLEPTNRPVLAQLLLHIAHADPRISYGFDPNGARFDPATGELAMPLNLGKGLTCATFIPAVLATYEYRLVDMKSWPARPEDEDWQTSILDLLNGRADPIHIEAVRNDFGSKRLRPNEVTAAATISSTDWPVVFDAIQALSQEILDDLA